MTTSAKPMDVAETAAEVSSAPERSIDDARATGAPRISDASTLSASTFERGSGMPTHVDEPRAVEQLRDQGANAEWERRASWLESEARAQNDEAARARLLLAASEIQAICGKRSEARRLAEQAASSSRAPAMALRQARALAHGDASAVSRSLREEARVAKSPPLQAHAHYLAAEVARLMQHDDAASEARLEAAEQSDPSDLRIVLQRVIQRLGRSTSAADIGLHPDESLRPLRHALGQLAQLRGAEAPRMVPAEPTTQPLVEAIRALARGQAGVAADALDALELQDELRVPVRWLVASWRAAAAGDSALLHALARVAAESKGAVERRVLAVRALAVGDNDVVLQLLDEAADDRADAGASSTAARASPAFSALDRASLTALAGLTARRVKLGSPSPGDEILEPLTSALQRLDGDNARPEEIASAAERDFVLGRAVASAARFADLEPFARASTTFGAALLRAEQHREARDVAGLARSLQELGGDARERAECSFVAAAWLDAAGGAAEAHELYRLALPSPAAREAAIRVMSREAEDAAGMFRSLAAQTSEPQRRSALLMEALFRMRPEVPEFDAVAEEALRNDPDQVFAEHLGEIAARMRGDRARVVRWLTRQRLRARGAPDHAFATLREACFVAETDRRAALDRLLELSELQREHPATARLRERLAPAAPRELAEARRAAAEKAGARARDALLAEAVYRYVQSGLIDSAVPAAGAMSPPLRAAYAERFASAGADLGAAIEAAAKDAQGATDPELSRLLLARLARLEERRGNREAARSWQRELLRIHPRSLSALRQLEIDSMAAGKERELEATTGELSALLSGRAMSARCFFASRLAIDRGAYHEARPYSRRAADAPSPQLWALRLESELARASNDRERLLGMQRELQGRVTQPLDVLALSVRIAEALAASGARALALSELERPETDVTPFIVPLALRAELVAAGAEAARAAAAFEVLANAAQSASMRTEAWFRAASIWLDLVGNRERGAFTLRQAAACNVPHAGVRARYAELFGSSLEVHSPSAVNSDDTVRADASPDAGDPDDTVPADDPELLLADATALAAMDKRAEARRLLDGLLARYPDHVAALASSAALHFAQGSWAAAEYAWWRIVDVAPEAPAAFAALRGLSGLYENELLDAERCCSVYDEILKRQPDDLTVRRRLVRLLTERGDFARAALHQRELMERAGGDEERRQHLLELVELVERAPGGDREAERLLELAQRSWPENSAVLSAAVEYHQRAGNVGTARVLIERAIHGARNAIRAGRIEIDLFRMLALAARLGGDTELARASHAASAALVGHSPPSEGAGVAALDARFDDLLAPNPLSPALRHFLYAAGAALERTYAVDLRYLEASPLDDSRADRIGPSLRAFGLSDRRVMISGPLGFDCLCSDVDSPYVVLGEALVDHGDTRVLEFFLLRAMKLAKVNASALSRMPPSEVWAAVAGFLACFAPPWPAEGDLAHRLITHRNKVRPHITATFGSELGSLAAAVTANAVPQATEIGDALFRWASRAALLGTGDIGLALEAAWISSQPSRAMTRDLEGRVRWLATHEQARDLVGFSVSEAYTEARRRASLHRSAG